MILTKSCLTMEMSGCSPAISNWSFSEIARGPECSVQKVAVAVASIGIESLGTVDAKLVAV